MAEVATKKSINVVSNKKSEVCSVQSNNGLIDLDNITASNNQLISLCDTNDDEDDLILTNNTRNELDTDDKSLQELIESELALRICSNNEPEVVDEPEEQETATQPEPVKRIVLDRRQDPFDINTEFILGETEHCSLNEPYTYQNGHVSPDAKFSGSSDDVKPEPVPVSRHEEEEEVFSEQPEIASTIVIEETTDDRDRFLQDAEEPDLLAENVDRSLDASNPTDEPCAQNPAEEVATVPATCVDKYEQEEEVQATLFDPEPELRDEDLGKEDNWTSEACPQSGNQEAVLLEFEETSVNPLTDFIKEVEDSSWKEYVLSKEDPETAIESSPEVLQAESPSPKANGEPEEAQGVHARSFDDTLSPSEASTDLASTQEFIDTERRVLNEDTPEDFGNRECPSPEKGDSQTRNSVEEESNDNDDQNLIAESSSELSVSEPTFIEKTEVVISDSSVTIFSETKCVDSANDSEQTEEDVRNNDVDSSLRAPLATPDDEISDVSNACDSESREETITTSTSVVTSSNVKAGTKTKKKKIEGVAGNDASPNLTPRTKKTKKSKKSDLEKENISVKSSFNKFDALSKKTVLHVRSVDASKVQQQLNAVGQNGDTNPNCRSCGKVVFQMEQTKAEGLVWHKNCFRCVQCSKQLNVDNYESHESTLYCKPHFKELFQPKPVEESDQPVRPRKPEMIIRENEPKELPPDVVRASDKPDLGLEELSSLNVKSRFQVFEKAGTETNEIERSPSQIAVKRSPSILSKLAKFQAKGMDIGVADESLNGIPYEESSESEVEEETDETEEVDTEIVKAKRATRERPISFTKMDDIKNRWETTSQQGRREVQREARKEEIAGIRSRLFMGKQGKMKEMYQQAVAGSERVTKINAAEEIPHSAHARSIKERFERGEPIAASDDETDSKPKPEKADEEVIAAGISRKSRSLFLELDASAAKTGRPVTPNSKTPAEAPRRARDMDSPEREIYRDPDVVRAEDRVDEVVRTDTARKMLSIFRQMEENACKKDVPHGPKPLKRFTPPPEDKFAKPSASDSEEVEDEDGEESEADDSAEERDPNYVRASDKVEDEFLKQAQNAARAKTLCAKFERWEETDGKSTSNHNIAEMELAQSTGEQSSIESASSLRARFESLGSQTTDAPRTPKVKVNRFVEIQTTCTDVCESCEKKVYPLEKVETNNKIFHKQCFRCRQCNCVLRMDTFTLNNGKLYCIPHFKQLFITRGNYDEGFGVDPHKNKWTNSNNSTSPSPIAVSNGDL